VEFTSHEPVVRPSVGDPGVVRGKGEGEAGRAGLRLVSDEGRSSPSKSVNDMPSNIVITLTTSTVVRSSAYR